MNGSTVKQPPTRDEVERAFLADLRALLVKYGSHTALDADNYYQGYAECGQDIRMTVTIEAKYDKYNNMVSPMVLIDLGEYFTAETDR